MENIKLVVCAIILSAICERERRIKLKHTLQKATSSLKAKMSHNHS